tara:strand:- start:118 stop:744 length:627 start_codon:yes stop_codon:yes gene_type:complete
MANYREYLSGMGDGLLSSTDTGSGFFIDDTEIPAATWSEDQEFDSYGNPIPVFEQQVATIPEPRSMTPPEVEQSIYDMQYTQAQMNQAAKNLDALESWKNEFLSALTGLMSSSSKPKDEGRNKPIKIENLRGEKPGYSMAEGSNFWSVDETDQYWQTKEGFEEAMNLYGSKPSWVKEPSLEYNPKTGEYDPIVKEEFVDLKPTKRISL